MLLHIHVLSWSFAFVLFVISLFLVRGQSPASKIVRMVLRALYVLIIVTGLLLVAHLNFTGPAIVKGLLGILLVGLMEMILTKRRKGGRTVVLWVITIIVLVLVLYFGIVVLG